MISCDKCGAKRGDVLSEDDRLRVSVTEWELGGKKNPESTHADLCDSCQGKLTKLLTKVTLEWLKGGTRRNP